MLEEIIKGNIEKKTITQIYGPPGVGKTNICILSVINFAKKGLKVVYIDTEGSLSVERIKQICKDDFEEVLKNVIIYEPSNFEEQTITLEKILMLENLGLIVVDGIASLYRLELCDDVNENTRLNRILGKQILTLLKLAKKKNVAILVTNQVRNISGNRNETSNNENRRFSNFEAVGGLLLEYWSKSIIRIEKYDSYREMILEKHRYAKEGEKLKFRIVESGVELLG
ncbi:MAG: repair protein RadB [Methanothermococcus sp.]|jgi:DNA repair protein RadB|uniref:DNA repair and recombination protein RadB n=1 Tax=Methanothermococcus TaxID=155862 RepID=UPI00037AF918|nr:MULTISPECIES: DNA repair and recombination protein RadB [Methanothermococcus]MDK2790511.1 repair protein RadB [Methanothermococcus sp.]MDK2987279.1 repair protein RadB [Methanothermococcus sp.]